MLENMDLALLIAIFGIYRSKIDGTQIQKLVYLLKHKSKLPFSFQFKPYYSSEDLSEAINFLVGMKLLEENIIPTHFYSFRYDYQLTDKGKALFSKIQKRSDLPINTLKQEIEKFEDISTPELVKLAKDITGIESLSTVS